MSDFWDRCRRMLRDRMRADEWALYIQSLHAWMDAGTLYLWVGSPLHPGTRSELLNHVRSEQDDLIRETVRRVNGGRAVRVAYLDRHPNREKIINERRSREHRVLEDERGRQKLEAYRRFAMEECTRLATAEQVPHLCGTFDQQRRQLTQLIENAAKRRLEQEERSPERWRALRVQRHGAPPRNPPPWQPPPTDREAKASPATSPRAPQPTRPTPRVRDVATPTGRQAEYATREELQDALKNLSWLNEGD